MTHRLLVRRVAVVVGGILWLLGNAAPAAQAHPLGNFSTNHYTGFTLSPSRLDVLSVTDTAEIPTLQAAPRVDSDGDGSQSAAERAAWAKVRCKEAAARLAVTTHRRLTWTITSTTFTYRPGQAGLRTGRLECRLRAPLDLEAGPVTLKVDTGTDPTRVGWNEITAKATAAHLRHSTVPDTSATRELRSYPRELLATPRGDTRAQFTAVAGAGTSGASGASPTADSGDGFTAGIEALSQQLASMAGTQHLTVPVGMLAVLLSIVLGAGHALLPGHGKTVMAAYLAGKRGRTRDAVTVGATVTATHTAGVLIIGLCLTTFSSLAGDTLLTWLGVTSGALVTAIGAALLTDALRRRARPTPQTAPGHLSSTRARQPALVGATEPVATSEDTALPIGGTISDPGHEHRNAHTHEHDHNRPGHSHTHDHTHPKRHRHGLLGHHHTHAPHTGGTQPFTTRGLVGLGVAGGLAPSPSALVVLLGAIALGRTGFGATLVVAYGLGMAATLTATGLLLVKLGDRAGNLQRRRPFIWMSRILPYTAVLTALLVLIVGLGMVARSLPTLL